MHTSERFFYRTFRKLAKKYLNLEDLDYDKILADSEEEFPQEKKEKNSNINSIINKKKTGPRINILDPDVRNSPVSDLPSSDEARRKEELEKTSRPTSNESGFTWKEMTKNGRVIGYVAVPKEAETEKAA